MTTESIIGVIGGTALTNIDQLRNVETLSIDTPYGRPSSDLTQGTINHQPFVFLVRHGIEHNIPPHLINYRANIWALREAGVSEIIAIATVGGITKMMAPGSLVVPDQLIDYSWGRAQTYFDEGFTLHNHIEFTHPYDQALRQRLLETAARCDLKIIDGAVMGVTQGPRLETAAEIERMKRDGCDLVGMTGMPEASLARELEIPYACLAVVVNWAAGVSRDDISMEGIEKVLREMEGGIGRILGGYR
ncbi:MAG: S-methyl-5'-thioinosine phosphorylase [Gammaproteobacteria bacterium]|nr:S-methyl-5'-thioinosine phosphorylase [Gammaproteobacteria bacterium]